MNRPRQKTSEKSIGWDTNAPDYKQVKQHSIFIKRLKFALILGVILIALGIQATITTNVILYVKEDGRVKMDGDDVIIQNPHFSMGKSFITADEGRINIKTKQATFTGNVKTVLADN